VASFAMLVHHILRKTKLKEVGGAKKLVVLPFL
jgi:hypothetical protein